LRTSLSRWQNEAIKIRAFAFKNWIMTKRNTFAILEVLFWPVVGFLSVGLLAEFAALNPQMRAFILIGVVSMGAIQVCQLDVAYSLLYDVWSKALKHGFVAPVAIRHMLLGSLLVGIIRGTTVFAILLAASFFLFDFNFMVPGLGPIVLFALGLFLNAAMVGMLVCILVFVFGYRAEVAAWSLVSLMLLVCGIYYPVSVLPGWAAVIAECIPLTYFLDYFRQYYGFAAGFSAALFKGYALLAAYLGIEVLVMKVALARAKRRGILLKLSE
jgi:ABC-2 type transport system permease protein